MAVGGSVINVSGTPDILDRSLVHELVVKLDAIAHSSRRIEKRRRIQRAF
jgi:hypothetical protein